MLARLLERDRAIILGGVVGLAALAWVYLWRGPGQMGMEAAMPGQMPWTPAELGTAAATWGVMMVAMMLPSAAPVLLLYSSAQRKRQGETEAARLVGCFAGGYLLVWLAWSVLAAGFQWALQRLALLSPHLRDHEHLPGRGLPPPRGRVSVHAMEIRLPAPLPVAPGLLPRELAGGGMGCFPHGAAPRGLLPGVLLGADGTALRRRRHEPHLGHRPRRVHPAREGRRPGPWLSRTAGAAAIGWGLFLLHRGLGQ